MNDQCLKENKFRLLETRNKKPSLMSLMLKSEFLLTPLSTPSAPYVQLPSFAPIIITTTARGIVHDWQTTRNGWCHHTNKRRQRGEEGPIVQFFRKWNLVTFLNSWFQTKTAENGFNTICISKCVIKKFQYNDLLPPPSSSRKKKKP